MKLKPKPKNRSFQLDPLLLAFLIPFLGMLGVLLVGGYSPFSTEKALLYSDEYHQYYPFFVSFRKALLSGDSLLYSWSVGMGMDYLGLISYYLGSPLNLLSILVPEEFLLEYFSLLSPIKLGLAGLFFAIFLKHAFHKDDHSIALFGGAYALCAWTLGYQWNIMWLDSFALLPLVALGTLQLLKDKKKEVEQAQGELSRVTEELDEATRKKEIALELYHRLSTDTESTDLFDKVVDLTYENEQLRSKIQVLQDKLEKAYEFMKQFVINGRNMLDVFRERIGEVKEWVNRKVAGMGR